RFGGGGAVPHFGLVTCEHQAEQVASIRLVVHHEHTQVTEVIGRRAAALRNFAGAGQMIESSPSRLLAGGGKWKRHCEARALPLPATRGADCSAVRLRQVAHDCQPQTETAVRPARVVLELAEAVEDEGEKLRFYPLAGVAHGEPDIGALAFETDLDLPF